MIHHLDHRFDLALLLRNAMMNDSDMPRIDGARLYLMVLSRIRDNNRASTELSLKLLCKAIADSDHRITLWDVCTTQVVLISLESLIEPSPADRPVELPRCILMSVE